MVAKRPHRVEGVEESDVDIGLLQSSMPVKYKGEIRTLSGDVQSRVSDWVSTQNPALDGIIHKPGFPVGRVVAVIGGPSCGKTTQCYHVLAETQRLGGITFYIDAESAALDEDRAIQIGVDPSRLLTSQPDTLEDALDTVLDFIETAHTAYPNKICTIILDSVAGPPTRLELKEGRKTPGEASKIVGSYLRTISNVVTKTNVLFILVNQYRTKIGVMFGPDTTYLAEAPIRFYASLVCEFTHGKVLYTGEGADKEPIGIRAKVKVSKSKVSKPFSVDEFEISFSDGGIDMNEGLFRQGVTKGVILKPSTGWYQVGDGDKFRQADWPNQLAAHPEYKTAVVDTYGYDYQPKSKMRAPIAIAIEPAWEAAA